MSSTNYFWIPVQISTMKTHQDSHTHSHLFKFCSVPSFKIKWRLLNPCLLKKRVNKKGDIKYRFQLYSPETFSHTWVGKKTANFSIRENGRSDKELKIRFQLIWTSSRNSYMCEKAWSVPKTPISFENFSWLKILPLFLTLIA